MPKCQTKSQRVVERKISESSDCEEYLQTMNLQIAAGKNIQEIVQNKNKDAQIVINQLNRIPPENSLAAFLELIFDRSLLVFLLEVSPMMKADGVTTWDKSLMKFERKLVWYTQIVITKMNQLEQAMTNGILSEEILFEDLNRNFAENVLSTTFWYQLMNEVVAKSFKSAYQKIIWEQSLLQHKMETIYTAPTVATIHTITTDVPTSSKLDQSLKELVQELTGTETFPSTAGLILSTISINMGEILTTLSLPETSGWNVIKLYILTARCAKWTKKIGGKQPNFGLHL